MGLCLVSAYGHHGNQFLSRAVEESATEVRLATIAAEKTHSTEVKAFAETVKITGTTTWVAGGQFHMPFSYEIQELNCTH